MLLSLVVVSSSKQSREIFRTLCNKKPKELCTSKFHFRRLYMPSNLVVPRTALDNNLWGCSWVLVEPPFFCLVVPNLCDHWGLDSPQLLYILYSALDISQASEFFMYPYIIVTLDHFTITAFFFLFFSLFFLPVTTISGWLTITCLSLFLDVPRYFSPFVLHHPWWSFPG